MTPPGFVHDSDPDLQAPLLAEPAADSSAPSLQDTDTVDSDTAESDDAMLSPEAATTSDSGASAAATPLPQPLLLLPEIERSFCRVCRVFQPMRSRHCLRCRRCVRRFDHHCPYLDTCVGEQNHRWFIAMLLSHVVMTAWSISLLEPAAQPEKRWTKWLWANGMLLFALLLSVFGLIACFILTIMHVYLAATNQTTWEYFSREKIAYLQRLPLDDLPFDAGFAKNIRALALSAKPRDWERLYARYLASRSVLPHFVLQPGLMEAHV